MKTSKKIIRIFIALLLLIANNSTTAISTYHIGNSLTWDAIAGQALKDVFAKGGISLVNNHHIRCASSLSSTLQITDDACHLSDDGPWDVALPNNAYDFLILQPAENSPSTVPSPSTETEIAAMQKFASMTNAQVVIYEAYPGFYPAKKISDYYHLPDQTKFRQTQSEFSQIRTAFPNSTVIPAMKVLVELDILARQGNIPGMNSAQDFYRDSRHLNEFGQYVLGLTFFTTLTNLDPGLTGLDLHENYDGVTDQQALIAQNTVREVVLGSTSPVPFLPGILWFLDH